MFKWEVLNRAYFLSREDAESYCLENRLPFSKIFELKEGETEPDRTYSSIRCNHKNFTKVDNPLNIRLTRDDLSSRIKVDDNKEGS